MCSKGLVKRFIPFFLTFAAGLLIASFFVPISGPNFTIGKRRQKILQLETENQLLKDKVAAQELEIRRLRTESLDWSDSEHPRLLIDGEPLDVPAPPPIPKAPAPLKKAR